MRKDFEDDGRTIADMSEVGGTSLFGHLPGSRQEKQNRRNEGMGTGYYDQPMSGKERGWAILGALKAGLLIGLAFIGGLGLVILCLMGIWHIL